MDGRVPLTNEQRRIVEKVLHSRPTPVAPHPTLAQRCGNYSLIALYCTLSALLVLVALGVVPLYSVYFLLPAALAVQFLIPTYLPFSTRNAKPVTLRHIRKLIDPHHGFVCLRCHYPLTSLPDDGQCPECGTLYTRQNTVHAWKHAYKLADQPSNSTGGANAD